MVIIYGDILSLVESGEYDVLVHGCNCFCNMGAGIALHIKNKYPEALMADKRTREGDRDKLGSYSKCEIVRPSSSFVLVNAYTQYKWNSDTQLADYSAIRAVFKKIKQDFSGERIIYPKIGAGLAKGDWKIIEKIINEELYGEEHYCVEYKKR